MASGIRRVGKSTIVRLIISELLTHNIPENSILYVNKESLDWDFIKTYQDLYDFIKKHFSDNHSEQKYIFIDEVQEIAQ